MLSCIIFCLTSYACVNYSEYVFLPDKYLYFYDLSPLFYVCLKKFIDKKNFYIKCNFEINF